MSDESPRAAAEEEDEQERGEFLAPNSLPRCAMEVPASWAR